MGGGKTDWVGKKLTSQIFSRGEKLTGEKTDRYTGPRRYKVNIMSNLKKVMLTKDAYLSSHLADYHL